MQDFPKESHDIDDVESHQEKRAYQDMNFKKDKNDTADFNS